MRYYITHKVDARYISVVDAKSTEEALELAKNDCIITGVHPLSYVI